MEITNISVDRAGFNHLSNLSNHWSIHFSIKQNTSGVAQ